MTAALAVETFPASSRSRTVNDPLLAINPCRAAAVPEPRVKETEVSVVEIEESVAITVVPSRSSAEPAEACPAVIVAVADRSVLVLFNVNARAVPPTPIADNEVGVFGATVSIAIALLAPSEPDDPGAATKSVALFPAMSRIDPPLIASAVVECWSRSAERSPAWTVYRKIKVVVPEPLR